MFIGKQMDVKRLLGIIIISLVLFMGCSSASDFVGSDNTKRFYKTTIKSDDKGAIASYTSWYSGVVIQADENTFPANKDFILIERPSLPDESNVYGQSLTSVYRFAPADDKTILSALDKPLFIRIPNYYLSTNDNYSFFLGIKLENSKTWEYYTIVPDEPFVDHKSRLAVANNSFFIIKTYRLNREFTIFAKKKDDPKPDPDPEKDLFVNDWKFLTDTATCSVKVVGADFVYDNDINITTLATANDSKLYDSYELYSEVLFITPSSKPVSSIKIDNKPVEDEVSDTPIATNKQYLHTLKINNYDSSKKSVIGNIGSFTFALNLKNVAVKEFPQNFNIKSYIKNKKNVVFTSESQINLNIQMPEENASSTIVIDDKYVYMGRWLCNPIFAVDFGKTVAEEDRAGIAVKLNSDSEIIPVIEWNEEFSKLSCSFDSPLVENKEYTVSMEGVVHDAKNGNIIGNFDPFTFTTLENITVAMVEPKPDSTSVNVDSSIVLELSDSISWNEASKACFALSDGKTELKFSSINYDLSANKVTLIPEEHFKYKSNYFVTVKSGLKNDSRDQNVLPIGFKFTTISADAVNANALINESAVYNERYARTVSFNVDFGKDVADKNAASASINLLNALGDSLNTNKTWSDSRYLVITNANELSNDSDYKLTMNSVVLSADGGAINPFEIIEFKTIPLLTTTLAAVDVDASGALVDTSLKLEFSDEILWDDANDIALISLSQNGVDKAFTCTFEAPKTLTVKPSANLAPNTNVTVAINGGAAIVESYNKMNISKKEMTIITSGNMLNGDYPIGAGVEESPFIIGDALVALSGGENLRLIGSISLNIADMLAKYDDDIDWSQSKFKLSYYDHGYSVLLEGFDNCFSKIDLTNQLIEVGIPLDKLWKNDRNIDIVLDFDCVASGSLKYYKTAPQGYKTEIGTELGPLDENSFHMVYTPAQLDNVRNLLSESYIQVRDINISPDNYQSTNNTSAEGWQPIGTVFTGIYDGNNRKIKGLTINKPSASNQGLFETCDGATLKNITLESGNIICQNNSGSLIGQCLSNTVKVLDCKSFVNINGNERIGGIVGNVGTRLHAERVSYEGNLESSSNYAGGIVGYITASELVSFDSCINNGSITCAGNYSGGIAGYFDAAASSLVSSKNHGDVCGVEKIGGIVGAFVRGNINNCKNTGNVVASGDNSGGICGSSNDNTVYDQNENSGAVTGLKYTGGIVGLTEGTTELKDCLNTSSVSGEEGVGGIFGITKYSSISESANNVAVEYCVNNGSVSASGADAGGIGGMANNSSSLKIKFNLRQCLNTGNVTAKGYVAGIVGRTFTSNSGSLISNVTNTGTITGTDMTDYEHFDLTDAAGLVGSLGIEIQGGWNKGDVIGKYHGVAGITGFASVKIDSCINEGKITGEYSAAGLADKSKSVVTNCINLGDVYAEYQMAAGLVASSSAVPAKATLYNCYSIGSVNCPGVDGQTGVIFAIAYGPINSCFTTTDSKINGVNVSEDPAVYTAQLAGKNGTLNKSYVFSNTQKFNPAATWNSAWNPTIWDNLEENKLPTLKNCGYTPH